MVRTLVRAGNHEVAAVGTRRRSSVREVTHGAPECLSAGVTRTRPLSPPCLERSRLAVARLSRPLYEHTFVTSQALPTPRFPRALASGNLLPVRTAAAELGVISLADTLSNGLALLRGEPARYGHAAVRFDARLVQDSARVEPSDRACRVAGLRAPDRAAASTADRCGAMSAAAWRGGSTPDAGGPDAVGVRTGQGTGIEDLRSSGRRCAGDAGNYGSLLLRSFARQNCGRCRMSSRRRAGRVGP